MENDSLNTSLTREQLFNQMSKAIESGDTDTLDKLMAVPEPVDEDAIPQIPVQEQEVAPVVPAVEQEEVTPIPAGEVSTPPAEGDPTLEVEPVTPAPPTPEEMLTAANARIQAVEAELHRFKSDAGRVPGLQKRMAELEKRLTTPKGGDSDPNSSNVALSAEQKAALDELRENDPVLAGQLEKALVAGNVSLRQELEERQREADTQEFDRLAEEYAATEYQRLVAAVPLAPQVFKSPEWGQWKNSLKPSDRQVAESNNAEDVYKALVWFNNDYQRHFGRQFGAAATPVPTPASVPAPSVAPAATANVPQAAPRPKANLAAQAPGAKPTIEDMYAQVWKEVGDREGYKS